MLTRRSLFALPLSAVPTHAMRPDTLAVDWGAPRFETTRNLTASSQDRLGQSRERWWQTLLKAMSCPHVVPETGPIPNKQ